MLHVFASILILSPLAAGSLATYGNWTPTVVRYCELLQSANTSAPNMGGVVCGYSSYNAMSNYWDISIASTTSLGLINVGWMTSVALNTQRAFWKTCRSYMVRIFDGLYTTPLTACALVVNPPSGVSLCNDTSGNLLYRSGSGYCMSKQVCGANVSIDFLTSSDNSTVRAKVRMNSGFGMNYTSNCRYKLVHFTKSRYLNSSNNAVAFKFDSVQVAMTKVIFHDFWYWNLFRGRIEIMGFPKRKTQSYGIPSTIQEEFAMTTIYRFFFDRPGTVFKKLHVTNSAALEYCPTMYVSDEVILWNHADIPIDYYKKIQPVRNLRKATIYQERGAPEVFELPLIANAEEWHVIFDVPVSVFFGSKARKIVWENAAIPLEAVEGIYEDWKTNNRPEKTKIELITNYHEVHLFYAARIRTAVVLPSRIPGDKSHVYLELNDKNLMDIYCQNYSLILEVITKESFENRVANDKNSENNNNDNGDNNQNNEKKCCIIM